MCHLWYGGGRPVENKRQAHLLRRTNQHAFICQVDFFHFMKNLQSSCQSGHRHNFTAFACFRSGLYAALPCPRIFRLSETNKVHLAIFKISFVVFVKLTFGLLGVYEYDSTPNF